MMAVLEIATSANGTPTRTVPPAPRKPARRADSGERAEKIRCMKSIATMSPIPSDTSVAQLITAPDSALVSCSKSNGPLPAGMVMPWATLTHASSANAATTMTATLMIAV